MKRILSIALLGFMLAGCVSNATIDEMNARHAAQMQQIQTTGADQ